MNLILTVFIIIFLNNKWQLQTHKLVPHTWEEPLASLYSVVTHAEVSAGVNHRLLIHKTHIVFHLFAQTKDVVALCDYRGHVARMESDKITSELFFWIRRLNAANNLERKWAAGRKVSKRSPFGLQCWCFEFSCYGNRLIARELGESWSACTSSAHDVGCLHGTGVQGSSINKNRREVFLRKRPRNIRMRIGTI